jgi:hypothetical protein
MTPVGFEPTIPAGERPQTNTLGCPSSLHAKYRVCLAVLTFQNTCVFGQNVSIARLFYSLGALTILRDFRDKKYLTGVNYECGALVG